jgi:hypothetical protein
MKKARARCLWISGLLFAFSLCYGESGKDNDTSDNLSVTTGGFVGFENGQIVKGFSGKSSIQLDKGWQEKMLVQFSSNFTYKERLKLVMAVEGQLGFSFPQSVNDMDNQLPRFWLYPADVTATYTLGNMTQPYLQFGFGYFPFKYNKYVRNLGEFLFRSGTYPPYILNSFNTPFARLLGLRVSSTLFGSLKQDLLFTSDAAIFPTQDFSLSYLTHYTIANCLEIGAGVSLAHFFSIEGRLTSPTQFPDPMDTTRFTSPNYNEKKLDMYITSSGDTAYYSFKGIKPVAMFGFDPKPLLPSSWSKVFGKDDGLLYGEICVIGWQDFKNYNTDTNVARSPDYSNRLDRTVAMVGVNVPAFKALDVLSLECEYFPNRYSNSYKNVIDLNLPIYFYNPSEKITSFKWSLYAKKTFLDRYSIIGQIARDHMRPSFPSYVDMERDDVLKRDSDWWWVLRAMVKF